MLYCCILYIALLWWARSADISRNVLVFLFIVFSVKIILIFGNVLGDKLAGARAFTNFTAGDFRFNTFFPTLLLNIPGFVMGAGDKASALTNALLSVITPIMGMKLFTKNKIALNRNLIAFYFVPSIFLWGCFGLREYVIIFFIILAANSLISKRYVYLAFFTSLVIISRPEYIIFIPLFIVTLQFMKTSSFGKLLLVLSVPVFVLLVVPVAFEVALQNFTSSTVSGTDFSLLEKILDARFYRQFRSDGGETAFYTISEYQQMTLQSKIFSNISNGFFLIQTSNFRNIFVFGLDTFALLVFTFYIVDKNYCLNKKRITLILLLVSTIILISFMLVNAGNAFRMRFIPLFFLGIVFLIPNEDLNDRKETV